MPVDPGKREEYLNWLAKEYEEGVIVDKRLGTIGRIPFLPPMLTWACTGGAPIGHICRWWGPEGSGKSLANLGLIGGAQRFPEIISERYEIDIKFLEKRRQKLAIVKKKREMKDLMARFPDGMETVIFDTEQRFDVNFAARMGVDTNRVEIIDENIIENIIKQASAATEAFHLIIIDSAANAQSLAEAELEPGNELRGSGPRAWSRLKQLRTHLDRTQNTVIIVDQVRTQLGQMNHKGQALVTPPNVRMIKHNSSLSVQFEKGQKLYLASDGLLTDDYKKASDDFKALGTNGKEPHGLEMRCYVEKNSSGRPYRSARMRFKFPIADVKTGEMIQSPGFDEPFELLEIGQYFYVIEKSGSYYYLLDEKFKRVDKKGTKWHGEQQARAALNKMPDVRERILHRMHSDMLI